MLRLLPRETRFFDDFERQARHILDAATLLHDLVHRFIDVPASVKAIKEIEHEADQVTHGVVKRLHATFFAPIDRHDIHVLSSRLDDVLDFIEAAASAILVYRVKEATPESRALVDVVLAVAQPLGEAVKCLRTLDPAVSRHVITIRQLEHRADELLEQSIAGLFELGGDPIEIIKWKEIYETLEGVTDRCEDVANVIEAIMVKSA